MSAQLPCPIRRDIFAKFFAITPANSGSPCPALTAQQLLGCRKLTEPSHKTQRCGHGRVLNRVSPIRNCTTLYEILHAYCIYIRIYIYIYIYGSVSRVATPPPPPHGMGPPPPPPIPHTFCTRHCSETYISILLHARRCSETHIFILLDEPSRRIRWVDRAKLWRNANFKLQEWLRAVYRTLQCSANGIIYIYISMYIHIHKHQ